MTKRRAVHFVRSAHRTRRRRARDEEFRTRSLFFLSNLDVAERVSSLEIMWSSANHLLEFIPFELPHPLATVPARRSGAPRGRPRLPARHSFRTPSSTTVPSQTRWPLSLPSRLSPPRPRSPARSSTSRTRPRARPSRRSPRARRRSPPRRCVTRPIPPPATSPRNETRRARPGRAPPRPGDRPASPLAKRARASARDARDAVETRALAARGRRPPTRGVKFLFANPAELEACLSDAAGPAIAPRAPPPAVETRRDRARRTRGTRVARSPPGAGVPARARDPPPRRIAPLGLDASRAFRASRHQKSSGSPASAAPNSESASQAEVAADADFFLFFSPPPPPPPGPPRSSQ